MASSSMADSVILLVMMHLQAGNRGYFDG